MAEVLSSVVETLGGGTVPRGQTGAKKKERKRSSSTNNPPAGPGGTCLSSHPFKTNESQV